MALEKLQFRPEVFLNQTIAIYGTSNSGRTALAMKIYHTISNHIHTAYSFALEKSPVLYEPTIFREEINDEIISEILQKQNVFVLLDDTYTIPRDTRVNAINSFSNKDLNITQILVFNDDKEVPYNVRNKINIHIFTGKDNAQIYFARRSNGFTLNQINVAKKHILNTSKLVYFRQTDTFMYL